MTEQRSVPVAVGSSAGLIVIAALAVVVLSAASSWVAHATRWSPAAAHVALTRASGVFWPSAPRTRPARAGKLTAQGGRPKLPSSPDGMVIPEHLGARSAERAHSHHARAPRRHVPSRPRPAG
jgi:hypothetical protein